MFVFAVENMMIVNINTIAVIYYGTRGEEERVLNSKSSKKQKMLQVKIDNFGLLALLRC